MTRVKSTDKAIAALLYLHSVPKRVVSWQLGEVGVTAVIDTQM